MCHSNGSYIDPNVTAFGDYLCGALPSLFRSFQSHKFSSSRAFVTDAPIALVASALKFMQSIEPDPEFILWTGLRHMCFCF